MNRRRDSLETVQRTVRATRERGVGGVDLLFHDDLAFGGHSWCRLSRSPCLQCLFVCHEPDTFFVLRVVHLVATTREDNELRA